MNKRQIKAPLINFIDVNLRDTITKVHLSKKIGMDKLQPFCRDISKYEIAEFNGDTKFRNGDTIMARITPCLENGKTAMVNILDDNEVGHINRESLEVILKDIKTNNKDYLSKQYQDLSLGKFFDEVINYMIEYSFLKEEDNTYLVLPTIARFNGELVRSNTKQMDLFGGEDDV